MKKWQNSIRINISLLSVVILLGACGEGGTNAESQVSLCAITAYPPSTTVPSPILESSQVWNFYSNRLLQPMKVNVAPYSPLPLAPGLIFTAPYASSSNSVYGQTGALIMDNDGNPVWFRPLNSYNLMALDFKVQELYGLPVLTFWQGTLATPPAYTNIPAGSPESGACFYILNQQYQVIQTVKAFYGFVANLHEFIITPYNTALFLASKVVPLDLTSYGGPKSGAVYDYSLQEVDLKTNKLIYFWDALDHIPLASSHVVAATAIQTNSVWDAYHLNSLDLATDNPKHILISSRSTWTIYLLDKVSGNFIWRLAGDGNGDFKIRESSALFSWQHDARLLSNDTVSLFDDNCCSNPNDIPPGIPPSHGLTLNLNFQNMTANFASSYYHNPNLISSSQGNNQSLANGNKFIGWGSNGYYSEFAAPGNTQSSVSQNFLYDVQMPGNNVSYRSYRMNWIGMPDYPPSVEVESTAENNTVYASWNGSTQTSSWQVYAGLTKNNLTLVASKTRTGFETAIVVPSTGTRYYQVNALDVKGNVIGVSAIVKN